MSEVGTFVVHIAPVIAELLLGGERLLTTIAVDGHVDFSTFKNLSAIGM